ncbi:lipid-A-disaccharide synthase [uncultured Hydrogenophaga sp.]|uniref:lipid-A-disaccharide synthase n=1 Tax=uncultured Hydrogenophaga sp. TaxID=199683 RepID=UPI00265DC820|nr:lipid-A-disaccharide synthase [uncultured Hydrogenophaga sp.]
MGDALRLALVAGETSGDLLAGLLLGGVRERWPGAQACGIGGPQMQARGFEAWWPSEKLAVRGYVEVLRHYREIVGIRRQLRERLVQGPRPQLFIGVDAPDFNLDLEAGLKAAGIPTMHFVCPSIWAWRPDRIEKIRRSVDHVLCIFPFEPQLLQQHGIAATYVGHPLAQVIPMEPDRAAARRQLGLAEHAPLVALLPGSRQSELQYLGERFLVAARLMARQRPEVRFVLPAVPSLRAQVDALVQASGLGDRIQVLTGQSHAALAACDATLIASGTATLEAALFKRPMVIAYNMNWLSWQIMRRKQLQPWVGLPNILSNEFVVPEYLQDRATPEALASATLRWLDDTAAVAQVQARFADLHQQLSRDTPRLATDAIAQVIKA